MVVGWFGVGKGALACFFVGSLLLANACSADGEVSFDPPPDVNGGSGGGRLSNSHGGGGGVSSAGSDSALGGFAQGGHRAGSDAGDSGAAGSAVAGNSSGGHAGMGGVAGTAGSASGAGGKAGNGGSNAGNGGSNVGNGGMAGKGGSNAGNGGMAGNGGSNAGNGGMAGNGGSNAGNGGMAGMSGSGGGGNGDCVAATFGGHGYYFCGVVDSAAAAFTKCQALGMSLLSVESKAENTFALGKQKNNSWLGGTDALEEGEWQWTSTGVVFWDGGPKGTEIEGPIDGVFSDFLVGQPNDDGADETHENCLAISASGWIDVDCTLSTLRAACESTDPSVPPNP